MRGRLPSGEDALNVGKNVAILGSMAVSRPSVLMLI